MIAAKTNFLGKFFVIKSLSILILLSAVRYHFQAYFDLNQDVKLIYHSKWTLLRIFQPPFVDDLLFVSGSLNIHSATADALIEVARSRIFVDVSQVIPLELVSLLCDSSMGPFCPHVKFDERNYSNDNGAFAERYSTLSLPEHVIVDGNWSPYSYMSYVHYSPFASSAFSNNIVPPELVRSKPRENIDTSQYIEKKVHLNEVDTPPETIATLDMLSSYKSSKIPQWKHSVNQSYVPLGIRIEESMSNIISGARLPLSFLKSLNTIFMENESFISLWDFPDENHITTAYDILCVVKENHIGTCKEITADNLQEFSNYIGMQVLMFLKLSPEGWNGASYILNFESEFSALFFKILPSNYSYGLPSCLKVEWFGMWVMEYFTDEELMQRISNSNFLIAPTPLNPPLNFDTEIHKSSSDVYEFWHEILYSDFPSPFHAFVKLASAVGKLQFSFPVVISALWFVYRFPDGYSTLSNSFTENYTLKITAVEHNITRWHAAIPVSHFHLAQSKTGSSRKFFLFNALEFVSLPPHQRVDRLIFSGASSESKHASTGTVGSFLLGGIEVNVLNMSYSYKRVFTPVKNSNTHIPTAELKGIIQDSLKNSTNSAPLLKLKELEMMHTTSKSETFFSGFNLRISDYEVGSNLRESIQRRISAHKKSLQIEVNPKLDASLSLSTKKGMITLKEWDIRPVTSSIRLYKQKIPKEAPLISLSEIYKIGSILSSKVTEGTTTGYVDLSLISMHTFTEVYENSFSNVFKNLLGKLKESGIQFDTNVMVTLQYDTKKTSSDDSKESSIEIVVFDSGHRSPKAASIIEQKLSEILATTDERETHSSITIEEDEGLIVDSADI